MEKESFINSVNLNSNTNFPYLVLNVVNDHAYPRNPGFQVMHWHEDLQFIYVIEGRIDVRTLDASYKVTQGEAFFINKNVIHHVKRIGNCHYNSFLFPSYFLDFYPTSPVSALTRNITANTGMPVFHFRETVKWQSAVIELLTQLAALENDKPEFYPYEVLLKLSSLWLLMLKNLDLSFAKKESAPNLRMQTILRYIEDHYAEALSLADLAGSAHISKSECARCFHSCLHTTPYQYLTEYRLSRAAQLLKTTNDSVGSIAEQTGFQQVSHFGKCFREKTGCSPREYRKKNSP